MMLVLREPLALGHFAEERHDSVGGHRRRLWFGCHANEHSETQEHESPPLLPTAAPAQSCANTQGSLLGSSYPPIRRGHRKVWQKLGLSSFTEQLPTSFRVDTSVQLSRLIVQYSESQRGCSLQVCLPSPPCLCLHPALPLHLPPFPPPSPTPTPPPSTFLSLPPCSPLSLSLSRILSPRNLHCILERWILLISLEKEKPPCLCTSYHLMPPKEFRGQHLL